MTILEKIKQQILGLKKAAGVEAVLTSDGKIIYNVVVLSRNKNLISVEAKESNIEDIEKLKALIPKETPIAITINGRGVLHKKVSDSLVDDANLISQVLPNAKDTDFYLQKFLSGNALFLSVIRKENFTRIYDLFKANQLSIVSANSGPFIAADIIPFLKISSDQISLSGFNVTLKNQLITDFKAEGEKSDADIVVGEDKIPISLLAAYASAIHLFIHNNPTDGLDIDLVKLEAENFSNKKMFQFSGYAVLGFFLVLMLGNYVLYNYYKTENNRLSGVSSTYDGMIKDVEQLEKQVAEKESFLKRAGWLSMPRTSYYADQVASTIPSSIKLSGLKINPMNEKLSKRQRKQIFQSDTIYVFGVCSNPTVLNPWMKELKDLKWVHDANNVNYVHDPKTRSGNFEVAITLNEEF